MRIKKITSIALTVVLKFILLLPISASAQQPCSQPNTNFLKQLEGDWLVASQDRIAPGDYEKNTGVSTIRVLFANCGIEEDYTGTLKGAELQFKTLHVWKDSVTVSKLWLDSNHANPMLLEGTFKSDSLNVMWQRELKTRTLSVKHLIKDVTKTGFVSESYMRPRAGAAWQLTHRRVYTRKSD
ncbi:MAG: DUF1579 family protein [Calditrichia bacterium]